MRNEVVNMLPCSTDVLLKDLLHFVMPLCMVWTGAVGKIIGKEGTSERSHWLLTASVHRF